MAHYWKLIERRILHPRWWKAVLSERLRRLTDDDFRHFFPYHPSGDEWLTWFHQGRRLRFFFHPRNQKDFFLHQLTHTQSHEQILLEAEHTVENKFQTLGS
ncbi:MAG: hypothetical protein ACRDGA_11040, partial [Bacteroidota bacterium]